MAKRESLPKAHVVKANGTTDEDLFEAQAHAASKGEPANLYLGKLAIAAFVKGYPKR